MKQLQWTIAAALLAASSAAHAHALWTMPKPRDNRDGWKEGATGFVQPCGVARKPTQPVTAFVAGATLQVQWSETVNHPGCFLIDFSQDDKTFTMLANVKHMATGATPRPWQTMIALPAGVKCDACTLRLRQVMLGSENAACPPPNGIPAGVTYYSCANVVLADRLPDGGAPAMPDASAARDTQAAAADRPPSGGASGGGGGGGVTGGGTAGATGSGGGPSGGSAGAGAAGTGGDENSQPMTTATKHANAGGCSYGRSVGAPVFLSFLVVGIALARRRRR